MPPEDRVPSTARLDAGVCVPMGVGVGVGVGGCMGMGRFSLAYFVREHISVAIAIALLTRAWVARSRAWA